MLQEKFDNHPEVTQSRVEQQRLVDELTQYREFFDMGEREILVEEVKQLRNQVQTLLENYAINSSSSGRQRRLSLARISVQTLKHAAVGTECPSPSSFSLLPIPLEGPEGVPVESSSPLSKFISGETSSQPQVEEEIKGASTGRQYWEDEKREMELDWEERERDWMAVLEELREEAESYKRQAERRKQELDGEKRCSDEMQDALQMAMTGHARLLEQYAELQERHIILLAKHRKIKEG
jgi:kinesin family protein 15